MLTKLRLLKTFSKRVLNVRSAGSDFCRSYEGAGVPIYTHLVTEQSDASYADLNARHHRHVVAPIFGDRVKIVLLLVISRYNSFKWRHRDSYRILSPS